MWWLALSSFLLGAARAAESEFEEPADPAAAPTEPETHLSAELGGAYADGNVWYYTLNAAASFSHKWEKNQVSAAGAAAFGRAAADADGSGKIEDAERPQSLSDLPESARRAEAEVRYDRFVSESGSVYGLVGALNDIYSGYDLRAHEQVGYSRILVKQEKTGLRAELGADYAQEYYVEGVDPPSDDVIAARVLVAASHQFSDQVSITDEVEVFENLQDFDDVRVLNTAVLSSKLNSILSVKLSHNLNYDHQPVEGYKPLDHTTLVTLVATLR